MNNSYIFFSSSLLLAALLLFSACGEEAKTETKEVIKPVKFGTVTYLGGAQSYTFSGTAQSSAQAKLSFRTNGLVKQLNVKAGDQVKAGAIIAKLEESDAQLSLQQANASVENARVQRSSAESNLDRVRELYQVGSASLAEYEQAKAQYASTVSQFESAQKTLDLQQSQLSYFTVKAPVAGIISNVTIEENELAQAGSPIVTLNSGDEIELEVGIPEVFISRVKQGQSVSVKFSTLQDQTFEGRVTEVPFSANNSNTYPVKIAVLKASSQIRPGMNADVAFSFNAVEQVSKLIAPIDAVGEDNTGHFVYLLTKAGKTYTAVKTTVGIGDITAQGFEIRYGLQDGDLVATAGIPSLFDGRKVALLN